jgi:hypothetical protein
MGDFFDDFRTGVTDAADGEPGEAMAEFADHNVPPG